MSEKTCKSCKWAEPIDRDVMERPKYMCRFHPPKVYAFPVQDQFGPSIKTAQFVPTVGEDEFCAYYQQRPKNGGSVQ